MTKAMPFLRKYDITFLRPPPFRPGALCGASYEMNMASPKEKNRYRSFTAS